MKKVLLMLITLILNINIFSFSLNNLEFGESLKKEERKIKEYELTNNTKEAKKYSISTNSDNVEIKPKTFILSPQKEQKFYIEVLGKGKKGLNEFDLIIVEKNLNRDSIKKNPIYLNKVVRIKQNYFLKEKE